MQPTSILIPTNAPSRGSCDHEHNLIKRPTQRMTYEQTWCGDWYDCPNCTYSRLIESPELRAALAAQQESYNAGKS